MGNILKHRLAVLASSNLYLAEAALVYNTVCHAHGVAVSFRVCVPPPEPKPPPLMDGGPLARSTLPVSAFSLALDICFF